jgi:hypothetical protein
LEVNIKYINPSLYPNIGLLSFSRNKRNFSLNVFYVLTSQFGCGDIAAIRSSTSFSTAIGLIYAHIDNLISLASNTSRRRRKNAKKDFFDRFERRRYRRPMRLGRRA